jgi:hypothetical protein
MTKATEDAVRDAFRRQAEASAARGSPFEPTIQSRRGSDFDPLYRRA